MSTQINVENLMKAMMHRRSFKPTMLRQDAVPPELIEKILEAANWAPSHGDTEPWRFSVYVGDGRKKLADAVEQAYRIDTDKQGNFKQSALDANRERAYSAPVWIAIGMTPATRPDGTLAMSTEEEMMAVACAVQNMHLMASALGLAAKWTTNPVMNHPHVAETLGLTPPSRLLGFFFVGWPAGEWPEGKRRPVTDKVKWIVE